MDIDEKYMTLEQLESLLTESGYMCFGHGTGRAGNSDEIIHSIFNEGLRTKDNSLYYTSIGLSTPTPELKKQYKELGLPEPSLEDLKKQFNNWQHQDSKKIIIIRLPIEYINNLGDRSDRDGEMFGAFYTQKEQTNGNTINYLDSRFILGCFDVEKQMVILNEKFEKERKKETINEIREKYKKALEKSKTRLERTKSSIKGQEQPTSVTQPTYDSYDSFDFPEIEWENSNDINMKK